jgi:NAD(P)H dehydrogenase (quinone)
MIGITGATGQLGQLVLEGLLAKFPASQLVAVVRNPAKAAQWQAKGVQVRQGDYSHPEQLEAAFHGLDKLLLISSSEVGQREPQHRAVIEAAKRAKVGLIAYTSILHADTSPLGLAAEHVVTEKLLAASGVPHVLLRNGWYHENYEEGLAAAQQYGVILGSAKLGRIASASRSDYAAAAVAVLSQEGQAGRVYELAGDESYTMKEQAALVSSLSGKSIAYQDLPEAEYKAALQQAGLPEPFAALLTDSDVGASKGGLFDDQRQLSRLIGRPTQPIAEVFRAALKKQA